MRFSPRLQRPLRPYLILSRCKAARNGSRLPTGAGRAVNVFTTYVRAFSTPRVLRSVRMNGVPREFRAVAGVHNNTITEPSCCTSHRMLESTIQALASGRTILASGSPRRHDIMKHLVNNRKKSFFFERPVD